MHCYILSRIGSCL